MAQHVVVGLGNPGNRYAYTRHNVGFACIDNLLQRQQCSTVSSFKNADVWRSNVAGCTVLWVKPLTFMNLSGEAVGPILRYFKLQADALIVVHDELDVPAGEVRLKVGGGHAGHRGLMSLIEHLGADFARLRVGIGRPQGRIPAADYVLAPLTSTERDQFLESAASAAQAVGDILRLGLTQAMNGINRRPKAPPEA